MSRRGDVSQHSHTVTGVVTHQTRHPSQQLELYGIRIVRIPQRTNNCEYFLELLKTFTIRQKSVTSKCSVRLCSLASSCRSIVRVFAFGERLIDRLVTGSRITTSNSLVRATINVRFLVDGLVFHVSSFVDWFHGLTAGMVLGRCARRSLAVVVFSEYFTACIVNTPPIIYIFCNSPLSIVCL